ncbi:Beta-glucuronidase [Lachnellula arida]|uniref:Beta-glucuronidase n=1 Tax=Lachnellula arida TaxID=1316785 RepID=A0A8T9B7A8_9HELO|nr:Beta-glucuronidase [Lachnellula arida]
MFFLSIKKLLCVLPVLAKAATVTYTVPTSAPTGSTALDPAPVGLSFEFFAFPSYVKNVTATNQCLQNFETLTGKWPPIRIGGTTQCSPVLVLRDRATYDPNTSAYVVYTVAAATDAPAALTFGPSFMTLADTYDGTVVLGLNRGHDNITNTIAAAKVAKSSMANLLAIELGNEPESGNSNSAPPTWGAAELIATENATAKSYVYDYAHHNYPGGTITSLMSHSTISSNVGTFTADIAAAVGVGKDYVLGETNSGTSSPRHPQNPTKIYSLRWWSSRRISFVRRRLWTMDYILRASLANIKRTYFHHGTIGLCYYCWWGRYSMGAPYYGAYAAVAALAGGSYISALDTGSTNYAAYIIYDSARTPLRALLYNSDYYAGTGTRGSQSFALQGLAAASGSVRAKRLTAAGAGSRVDEGSNPTFGGQTFANGTCVVGGTEVFESTAVVGGGATFTVAASEALLLYLQ